jgi:bifunctional UDP-N-acetylglucosamine pyrophosphorylase / glucosamine-1-phosphate N-acetyltransferase
MQAQPVAGIILAAGKGTRMKSDMPKGLHHVCGLPMVEHIGRAMKGAGVERPVVVVGHGAELLTEALGDSYAYALQAEQHGTGHATLMARDALSAHDGPVLLTPGDTPLISSRALTELLARHVETGAACTMATCILDDPTGYGRILRNATGMPVRVVEEKDASDDIRRIKEVCTSIYCFDSQLLFETLPSLRNENAQGEYYLTDVIATLASSGHRIESAIFHDQELLMGVNDRWQLAEAAAALNRRILRQHALAGVTIADPINTFIGPDVVLEPDVTVEPMTVIDGKTRIGSGSRIGPNTRVVNSDIGSGCTVLMSHLSGVKMGEGSRCGPFANLRPGAVLGEHVKVGNFVEIKNSELEEDVSVSHLTYIGDSHVGSGTNIGAGTITCNYDGFTKHRTEIGKNAFVGSNTTLVAPLQIGDGALIAAGSVVTKDVPADAMAVGRAKQEVKEEWAAHWRRRKQSDNS